MNGLLEKAREQVMSRGYPQIDGETPNEWETRADGVINSMTNVELLGFLEEIGELGHATHARIDNCINCLHSTTQAEQQQAMGFCQMDYVSVWPDKRWTCRTCGAVVVRNGADGHPHIRCRPQAALSSTAAPAADRRRPCDLRAAEAVAILLGQGWTLRDEKWEQPTAAPALSRVDPAVSAQLSEDVAREQATAAEIDALCAPVDTSTNEEWR